MVTKNRTTETVIINLRAIFSRFGVPFTLVSDNAPEFTNKSFQMWLLSIGCRLMHSPEYRPQSNGLAERMVRVIKDGFNCYDGRKCTASEFLHRLLFVHRNTAMRSGKTSVEILCGRKVRCPILSHYAPMQDMLYRANRTMPPTPVRMLFRKGDNTSMVVHGSGRTVLAHESQLSSTPIESERRFPTRDRKQVRRYPDVDPQVEGWRM